MELWIIITIIAATTQTLRSAGQKKNEISARRFWSQLYSVFLCAAFCRPLALVMDEVYRTKLAPNHTDVLGMG